MYIRVWVSICALLSISIYVLLFRLSCVLCLLMQVAACLPTSLCLFFKHFLSEWTFVDVRAFCAERVDLLIQLPIFSPLFHHFSPNISSLSFLTFYHTLYHLLGFQRLELLCTLIGIQKPVCLSTCLPVFAVCLPACQPICLSAYPLILSLFPTFSHSDIKEPKGARLLR